MYEKEVEQLQNIIDDSKRIVFFGGAGVSTESNIPDFRSADGLYLNRSGSFPLYANTETSFMNFIRRR